MPVRLFRRGLGPLVSVLIPSSRPSELFACIRSFYDLAWDRSVTEFCIKIDSEDQASIQSSRELAVSFPDFRFAITVSSRGAGYWDLHYWLNDLASKSSGDWLFLFNDDARVITSEWDRRLLYAGIQEPWLGMDEICCMKTLVGCSGSYECLLLRRQTYELLGHLSLHPFVDEYIASIMRVVVPEITTEIEVAHSAPSTAVSRNNDILREILKKAPIVRKLKIADILKLSARLEALEASC